MTAQAALLLATACALAYQLGFAGRPDAAPSWTGSAVKTLSTLLLAAFGLMAGAPPGIVLGLILGATGDFALSRPGSAAFLAGVGAFAGGHLAYAATLHAMGAGPAGVLHVLALCLLAVLVLSTEVWLIPRTGALRWPVRGYVAVIAVMAVTATLLPPAPGAATIRTGAALFLLSDALLAVRLFLPVSAGLSRTLGLTLWPAYWSGQALILWGSLPS